ncbi:MAG: sigma-70 family RNA polymerase sigma factor [Pirellulaceae bacterium]|nr:sigma-70 family RNA polymerase sigma factor [Pirellulaceae bacterium]
MSMTLALPVPANLPADSVSAQPLTGLVQRAIAGLVQTWRIPQPGDKMLGMYETRPSLLLRVRNPDDAEAWSEFVALYQPLLVSYAMRKGLTENDAQDVAQEILINLVKALPKFELDHSKGRFRGWLWRIVYNGVMSWQRDRQRRDAAEDVRREEDLKKQLVEDGEPPAEWLAAERRRILAFAMERVRPRVKPTQWECFQQHLVAGRPAAEVAAELGITANLVFVNASRVLKQVREQCAEYQEELGDE